MRIHQVSETSGELRSRATCKQRNFAGAFYMRGTADRLTPPTPTPPVKVSTDVVAAERKLLDYHQAQGVFYPLIQVASTPPPSSSAASSPQSPSSPDGSANGASLQLQASIAVAGGLVLLILSGRSAPPRASRSVPRRS